MTKKYQKTLFIFRRDLRLYDNTALIEALSDSALVIPCFIFDPRQTTDHPYKSQSGFYFMLESLQDLNGQLQAQGTRLCFFEGLSHEIVEKIIKEQRVEAVYFNRDYTPFSQQRDQQIFEICHSHGVKVYAFHDCLLNPPDTIKKDDGGAYTVYTPYMRRAMTVDVSEPVSNRHQNYFSKAISFECKLVQPTAGGFYPGGRVQGLKILKKMADYNHYEQDRDFPALSATTKLSPHHKFGTLSIREVYHSIKKSFGIDHTLIRELYWRDFFTQIGFHFPRVLGTCFHAQYDDIHWENNPENFKRWCDGQTGFPIVDAGMRELNSTGFMQNRVRMITASFLVKDLHIDWRWGEKYFAQKLVDYDPLVNNGNWQWVASTGCDAQPYFRIFNPWLQQKKFDPKAEYIKKWLPELKAIPAEAIHEIEKKPLHLTTYPSPILSHGLEKLKALAAYKKI